MFPNLSVSLTNAERTYGPNPHTAVIGVSLACGLLSPLEFAAQTPPNAPARAGSAAETEELIAEKAPFCADFDGEDVATADGRTIAWRCRTNDKWTVLVNGVTQGGTFDDVRSLTFSLDGQRWLSARR